MYKKFFYLIIILFLNVNLFATMCCDGSYSSSTGRGTCSHHGGICPSTSTYTPSTPTYCSKPSIPSNFSASDGIYKDKIYLSWDNDYNADYYKIFKKTKNDYGYTIVDSYNYWNDYSYYTSSTANISFKVEACNECGCSKGKIDSGYIKKILSCSLFKIIDGDTLKYNDTTYRLYGIDAPESYLYSNKMARDSQKCNISKNTIQEAGIKSKEYLSNLIAQATTCYLVSKGSDSYGREVAIVYADNISANEQLVKNGYAIAWDKYIQEPTLKEEWDNDENKAALDYKGLWNNYCNLMSCMSGISNICNSPININISTILTLNKNWNLVSLPVNITLSQEDIKTTFKNAKIIWTYKDNKWSAISPINSIEQNIKNNLKIDTINSLGGGEGFWIKNSTDENISFIGNEYTILNNSKLTNTTKGWKLLGSGSHITPNKICKTNNFIHIIWGYKNNKWKAYSEYNTIKITTIKSIDRGEGFWILIK